MVETTNRNGKTWLDHAGNFVGRETRTTERFTLIDPNTLQVEVTIEDPAIYARPWTIRFPWTRHANPDQELMEQACYEGNNDLPQLHNVRAPSQENSR